MGQARYYHHNESFLISPLFRIKKDGRLHSYTPPTLHLHIRILGILKNAKKEYPHFLGIPVKLVISTLVAFSWLYFNMVFDQNQALKSVKNL